MRHRDTGALLYDEGRSSWMCFNPDISGAQRLADGNTLFRAYRNAAESPEPAGRVKSPYAG